MTIRAYFLTLNKVCSVIHDVHMKKFTALLLFVCLTAIMSSSHALTSRDYFASYKDCSSYGSDPDGKPVRVYLESQSWWQPLSESENADLPILDYMNQSTDDFGHIHIGTCFPVNQSISNNVSFKVLVTIHNFHPDTTMSYINPHIFGYDPEVQTTYNEPALVSLDQNKSVQGAVLKGSTGGKIIRTIINENTSNEDQTIKGICHNSNQVDMQTCLLGYEIELDTTVAPVNGYQEFRFFLSVSTPDNQELHVSTGWLANIDNVNKPYRDYIVNPKKRHIEARGWYTGSNYILSSIYDFLPHETVKSVWIPKIVTKKGPTLGAVIGRSSVHLNPNFHDNNPGLILFEKNGPISKDDLIPFAAFANDSNYSSYFNDGANKLVIKTEGHCNMNNESMYDDCNCAFNQTLSRGGINPDGSCVNLSTVPDPNNENHTMIVDNDSQKVSGLLIVPFNYIKNTNNLPKISIEANKSVIEPESGQTNILLKVSSDRVLTEAVTIFYKTVTGTARHPSDYGYINSKKFPVTISAGETTTFITVRIKADLEIEDDETFQVILNETAGGDSIIQNAAAFITIESN